MRANGDYDYAEEYETEILNAKEFKKILEFLDFKKAVTIEKHREYWMCGDIEVALDYIKGLGHFIEAEAKGNFKNEKEAKKTCLKFLKDLNIKNIEKVQILTDYPQLLLKSQR